MGLSNRLTANGLKRTINEKGNYSIEQAERADNSPVSKQRIGEYTQQLAQRKAAEEQQLRQQALSRMNQYFRDVENGRKAFNEVSTLLQNNQARKAAENSLQQKLASLPHAEIRQSNKPVSKAAEVAANFGNKWQGMSTGLLSHIGADQMAKLASAAVNKIPGLEGTYDPIVQALEQENQRAYQSTPIAYRIGARAGDIAKMAALSGAIGEALPGNVVGGIGNVGGNAALKTGLTFAGSEALSRIGDLATGKITPEQYARYTGTAAAGGLLAGEVGNIVGSNLGKVIKDKGMMTPLMEVARLSGSGIAQGTTNLAINQASAYAANDEQAKMNREQMTDAFVSIVGFSVLDGAIQSFAETSQAKADLQRRANALRREYDAIAGISRDENGEVSYQKFSDEAIIERINHLMEDTSNLKQQINGRYYAGSQVEINRLNDAIDIIQAALKDKMNAVDAVRSGAAGPQPMGNNILVDNINPDADATGMTPPSVEPQPPSTYPTVDQLNNEAGSPFAIYDAANAPGNYLDPEVAVAVASGAYDNLPAPVNEGFDLEGVEGTPVEDQLAQLAQQTFDAKEAQRQALYEAGKNRDQNVQQIMDNANMLSDEEKVEAIRQGNADRTKAELAAIREEATNTVTAGNKVIPAELEEASEDYPEDVAKTFVDNYTPSVPTRTYESGFYTAYHAAQEGVPQAEIDSPAYNALTKAQQDAAYQAGITAKEELDSIDASSLSKERKYDTIDGVKESITNLYPNASKGDIENAAEGITEVLSIGEGMQSFSQLHPGADGAGTSISNSGERTGVRGNGRNNSSVREENNGQRESGIRTVALGITDEFIKKGYVDLRGKKLSHNARTASDEVATLAMVFRNPKFETFRTVYTKGDEIVGTEAVTSYLVGGSAVSTKTTNVVDDIKDRMARLNADGYYILHNHPSGKPVPSSEDVDTSVAYSSSIPGYRGHIVIDHNTYSFIDAKGNSSGVRTLNSNASQDYNKRIIDSPYLYKRVSSPAQVADVAASIVHSPEYSAVIFASSAGEIRAIQEIHNNFVNSKDFQGYLRNRKRDFGSSMAFLATNNDSIFASSDIDNAYYKKLLTDVVQLDNGRFSDSFNYSGQPISGQFNSMGIRNDKVKAYRVSEETADYGDVQTQINQSMTMDQAKRMVQQAFMIGEIKEWFEDEYKNGDEWLAGEGSDAVAMVIENDDGLQQKYIDKVPGILNEDFSITDVLDAYKDKTLVGSEKKKHIINVDLSKSTGYSDNRFYAPHIPSVSADTLSTANLKATKKNQGQVYKARLDILIAAHNDPGVAESLGISKTELNKKLRSWSRYSTKTKELAERLNRNVAVENQWAGLQNCSIISHMNVSDDDINSMVKSITGTSKGHERRYIAKTILAIDTHADWSWLNFEFKAGRASERSARTMGLFSGEKIVVGGNAYENTVAHEMGHALAHKWACDIMRTNTGSGVDIAAGRYNKSYITDPDALKFAEHFASFMDSLTDVNDIRSSYTNDPAEVFARFIARFVEWANTEAGSYFYHESNYYDDKFTAKQYLEFVKLLQEKSALDIKMANIQPSDMNKQSTTETTGSSEPKYDLTPDQKYGMQQLEENNTSVAAMNDALRNAVTGKVGAKVEPKEAVKIAKQIRSQYKSTVNIDDLTNNISMLYDYMSKAKKNKVDEIASVAKDIGTSVLENSTELDDSMAQTYPNLKKEIKGYKLKLSDADKAEIAHYYDTYNNFRKAAFGRLSLSSSTASGTVPVDTAYQELNELYPELFPDNITNIGEQLIRMFEVSKLLDPQPASVLFGMSSDDFEEESYLIGQQILRGYFDAVGDKNYGRILEETIASNKAESDRKLASAKKANDKKLERLRERLTKQMEKAVGKEKKLKQEQIARLRSAKNDRIAQIEQNYQDRIDKANAKRKLAKTGNELLKKFRKLNSMKGTPEFEEAKKKLIGDFDLFSKGMRDDTRLKLEQMRDEAEALKETDINYANSNYEKDYKVFSRLDKKHINDLSLEEMQDLIEAATELRHAQEIANKVLRDNRRISAANLARKGIEQQKKTRSLNKNNELGSFAYRLARSVESYQFKSLSAMRALRAMDGYAKDGVLTGIGKDINNGHIKSVDFEMKARKSFEDFTNDKKFMASLSKPTVDIKDPATGRTAKITPGMRMAIYLMSRDPDNRRHIANGGLCIPNVALYTQRAGNEAYADDVRFRLDFTDLQEIYSHMTEKEKAFADRMFQFYNGGDDVLVTTKDAMNETSMQLNGHEIAFSDNHFPISTNKNFLQTGAADKYQNPSIEGRGFLKERNASASNPIYLEDATDVLNRSINNVKTYYGEAIPIRNAVTILNFTESGFDTSLRQEIDKAWKGFGLKLVDNIIDDVNAGGRRGGAEPGKLDKLQSRYVTSVFSANAGVMLKQFSSYPMAIAYLHLDSLAGGFSRANRVSLDYIDGITPMHWARRKGMSGTELGEVYDYRQGVTGAVEKMANRLTNGITHVDAFTTRHLAYACVAEMKKYHPELKEGTEEYNAKLAELINNVFQNTQPSYDVMQRSEYQRSRGDMARILSMFSTASLNMSGEVADAFGEFRAKVYQAKHGEATKEEAQEAGKRWFKVLVGGYIFSQLLYTMIGAAWNLGMHKGSHYRDENGEVTAESFLKNVGIDAAENIIGGGFFGGKQVIGLVTGNWDDMVLPGLSTFNSTANDAIDFSKEIIHIFTDEEADFKKIKKISFRFARDMGAIGLGIPVNMLYDYANMAYLWYNDYKERTLLESGEGLFGLKDTSVSTAQYANMAVSAASDGNMEKAERALNNTNKDQLAKALGIKVSDKLLARFREHPENLANYISYMNGQEPKLSDVPSNGFSSFDKLKESIGDPDRGANWHHIVEQEQGPGDKNLGTFKADQINNINNVVSLPSGAKDVHQDITKYYNSVQDFTNGETVRTWLSKQSFEDQWEFGIKKLQEYGDVVPTDRGWVLVPDEEAIAEKIPLEEGTGESESTYSKIKADMKSSEVKGDDRYGYLISEVNSGNITGNDVAEWADTTLADTNGFKAWKEKKYSSFDYVKYQADIDAIRDKYPGDENKKQRDEKLKSYASNIKDNQKRLAVWTIVMGRSESTCP